MVGENDDLGRLPCWAPFPSNFKCGVAYLIIDTTVTLNLKSLNWIVLVEGGKVFG